LYVSSVIHLSPCLEDPHRPVPRLLVSFLPKTLYCLVLLSFSEGVALALGFDSGDPFNYQSLVSISISPSPFFSDLPLDTISSCQLPFVDLLFLLPPRPYISLLISRLNQSDTNGRPTNTHLFFTILILLSPSSSYLVDFFRSAPSRRADPQQNPISFILFAFSPFPRSLLLIFFKVSLVSPEFVVQALTFLFSKQNPLFDIPQFRLGVRTPRSEFLPDFIHLKNPYEFVSELSLPSPSSPPFSAT